MTRRRFVLLDRDGTINAEREYLSEPDGVLLLPGAAEGLRLLSGFGLGLVVVTNQAGVGRGYYTMAQAQAVSDRLAGLLDQEGVTLDGVYMCPHAPDAGCACRKPAIGMVEQASRDLGFERPPYELATGHPSLEMFQAVAEQHGLSSKPTGMSFWTDAAILGQAGIPTLLFGPMGGGLHATEEYVELESVLTCQKVISGFADVFCGH